MYVLVTTTLSDDCDDVSRGRRGDIVGKSTDDDVIVGNAVPFSQLRSRK